MPYLILLVSSILGFFLNRLISKPNAKINKHLPNIKIKIFQFCPSIKINIGNRTIHIHHWLSYSFLLVITITFGVGGGLLDFLFIKGFFLGGIVQGLTFPDWKKIIYPKN
jgi:hypothetical protein